jgi:hypothetical protein
MRTWRLVAAGAALLLALFAAVLAHDVRSWRDTLHDNAVRYAAAPRGPEVFQAPTVLPPGLSMRLLAVERDRKWLSTLRFYNIAYHITHTVDPQYITPAQHAVINNALAALSTASQGDEPTRASQAFNLLALLELSQISVVNGVVDVAAADTAVANFQNAVRADPANAAAKLNLELELRALADNPLYDALAPAAGDTASGTKKGAVGRLTGQGY